VEFCRIVTATHSNIAIVDLIWSQTSDSRHSCQFQVATRSRRAIRPEGEVENTMTLRATLRTKLHASIKSQEVDRARLLLLGLPHAILPRRLRHQASANVV
jgi:hypothetical protein